MTAPKRVQMTRNRPWRAEHPDAVIVARPSKWGNPFKVGARYISRGPWSPTCPYPVDEQTPLGAKSGREGFSGRSYLAEVATIRDCAHAVALFRAHIAYEDVDRDQSAIRAELAGRDLACWCPLDQPCHADVLLELANGGDDEEALGEPDETCRNGCVRYGDWWVPEDCPTHLGDGAS